MIIFLFFIIFQNFTCGQKLVRKPATKILKINRKNMHYDNLLIHTQISGKFRVFFFYNENILYHSIRKIIRMKLSQKFIEQNLYWLLQLKTHKVLSVLSNPPSHSRELIPLGDANKLQREDYAQTLVLYSIRFIPKFIQIFWQRSEMQIQETKTNFKTDSLQSSKWQK